MHKKLYGILALASLSLGFSLPALAGNGGFGNILYGPGPVVVAANTSAQGIPLLGGFGLVILSVLLALVSVRVIKDRHRGGGTWLLVASLTAALSSAGGGIKLISDAHAGVISGGPISLTQDAGGNVTIPGPGFWTVFNNSSVTQRILNITINPPGCFIVNNLPQSNGGNGGNGGVGPCVAGATELDTSQNCSLEISCNACGPQGGQGQGGGLCCLNGGGIQGGGCCLNGGGIQGGGCCDNGGGIQGGDFCCGPQGGGVCD